MFDMSLKLELVIDFLAQKFPSKQFPFFQFLDYNLFFPNLEIAHY